MARAFMDGYKLKPGERGSPGDWQFAFRERMGFDQAMEVLAGESPEKVLHVSLDANWDAIKRSYRKLSRETHPDLGGTVDAFRRVQAAYEILEHLKGYI